MPEIRHNPSLPHDFLDDTLPMTRATRENGLREHEFLHSNRIGSPATTPYTTEASLTDNLGERNLLRIDDQEVFISRQVACAHSPLEQFLEFD